MKPLSGISFGKFPGTNETITLLAFISIVGSYKLIELCSFTTLTQK